MSTYEPGTVAVATVNGDENVRVFRTGCPSNMGWEYNRPDGQGHGWSSDRTSHVTDIRPLVALDPQDTDTLDRLVTLFHESWSGCEGSRGVGLGGALLKLTEPPRIPEPGLWGVVEAGVKQHDQRLRWVRLGDNYRPDDRDEYDRLWSDLIDPTLVRDGIEDGAS